MALQNKKKGNYSSLGVQSNAETSLKESRVLQKVTWWCAMDITYQFHTVGPLSANFPHSKACAEEAGGN